MQFTLLEDMAESGNPIAQFIGTVQPTTTNNVLQGEKRFWMDPVSPSMHECIESEGKLL